MWIGRHVCPGRFLAVVQMKLLMAVIHRHYDFKLLNGEMKRRSNNCFGPSNTPSHTAKLYFKQIRELPLPRVVATWLEHIYFSVKYVVNNGAK